MSDGHGGFLTDTLLLDSGFNFDVEHAEIDFAFGAGVDPLAFIEDGLFNLGTFVKLSDGGVIDFGSIFLDDDFLLSSPDFVVTDFSFDPSTGARFGETEAVPEPATLALLITCFLLLGLRRRRSVISRS